MARRVDHLAHRADLDDAPGIHHRHALRGLGDDAHVVGDEHDGRAALAGEALEKRDDLRLDRDVERGGRLVRDEQARLGREGERDHHALAHAAGEMVRIVAVARLGCRNADFPEKGQGALARRGFSQGEVGQDGFFELLPDGVQRVERGERVLEDHADLAAADAPQLVVAQVVDAADPPDALPPRQCAPAAPAAR